MDFGQEANETADAPSSSPSSLKASPEIGILPSGEPAASPRQDQRERSNLPDETDRDCVTPPALGYYNSHLFTNRLDHSATAATNVLRALAGCQESQTLHSSQLFASPFASLDARAMREARSIGGVLKGMPPVDAPWTFRDGTQRGPRGRGGRWSRATKRRVGSITCSERIQLGSPGSESELRELERFAISFKRRRTALGYTQWDVGNTTGSVSVGVDLSQTTISRFEALNLSYSNMLKLKPLLERWLQRMENEPVWPERGRPRSGSLSGLPPSPKGPETDDNANLIERCSPEGCVAGPLKPRKRRSIITEEIRARLEGIYAQLPRPSPTQLGLIAESTNMERDTVRVWFCNRRSRDRQQEKPHLSSSPICSNGCNIPSNLGEASRALPCLPSEPVFSGLFLGLPFSQLKGPSLGNGGPSFAENVLPAQGASQVKDYAKNESADTRYQLVPMPGEGQSILQSIPTAQDVEKIDDEIDNPMPMCHSDIQSISDSDDASKIDNASMHNVDNASMLNVDNASMLNDAPRRKRRKPAVTQRIAPVL